MDAETVAHIMNNAIDAIKAAAAAGDQDRVLEVIHGVFGLGYHYGLIQGHYDMNPAHAG